MATATTYDLNELKRRMQGAMAVLKQELSGLRTGRASPHLLDHVQAGCAAGAEYEPRTELDPGDDERIVHLSLPAPR